MLADLKLTIDGPNRVRGIYPKNLPDLFKGDQMVVLGRYEPGGKKGKITLEGTIRGKKKTFEYGAVFPKKKEGNSFIPAFGQPAEWAIFWMKSACVAKRRN